MSQMLDDIADSPVLPARRSLERRSMSHAASSALMLIPALALSTIFIFIPAALTIIGSFYSFGLTSQNWVWVGGANYAQAVVDPIFWVALRNNVIIVIGSIV